MKKIIAVSLLSVLPFSAMAAERGFYLGGFAGQAKYDASVEGLDEVLVDALESEGLEVLDLESGFDDKATPWSLFGGYSFSRFFAAELGYVNLGSADYSTQMVVTDGEDTADVGIGLALKAKGFTAALVGRAPIGERFDVHARAGMLRAKMTFEMSANIEGEPLDFSDDFSANSNDMFYGVGAAWSFNDRASLSADWTRYADVGDEDETGEGDIDTLTLSFIYRL